MDGQPDKKKKILLLAAVVILALLMAGITLWLWPYFRALSDPEAQARFQQWVSSLGVLGWLMVLGLQVVQVVVAIIPGEPVEVLTGVLYGTWGGLLTCMLGVLIGSLIVFWAVRLLGSALVKWVFGEEKLRGYRFLQNIERLETITFILFFIPGTPKDILTYVAGITPIKPVRFLFIACFARIPSILSSTWAGATLISGNLWGTVLIFAVMGAVSLVGIMVHRKLMHRYNKNESEEA